MYTRRVWRECVAALLLLAALVAAQALSVRLEPEGQPAKAAPDIDEHCADAFDIDNDEGRDVCP